MNSVDREKLKTGKTCERVSQFLFSKTFLLSITFKKVLGAFLISSLPVISDLLFNNLDTNVYTTYLSKALKHDAYFSHPMK